MKGGPHKLAPTASDLVKHDVGTVFAGFHYDFNFLTIHGKSRYPGLFAWLRTGERFTVNVPEGHLLLQAGKQFEWLTGGYINCGYHEVIYTEKVKEAK
jgi:isopenicillin N synthase-like dioxygenase